MTEGELLKNLRIALKLEQTDFAVALERKQGTISGMETSEKQLAEKFKKKLNEIFFVNPDYFSEPNSGMFIPGKEDFAIESAKKFIGLHKSSVKGNNLEVGTNDNFLLFKLEQQDKELSAKDKLLESKDEMIVLLKSQLKSIDSQYQNLVNEMADLRKQIAEGTNDPNAKTLNRRSG